MLKKLSSGPDLLAKAELTEEGKKLLEEIVMESENIRLC